MVLVMLGVPVALAVSVALSVPVALWEPGYELLRAILAVAKLSLSEHDVRLVCALGVKDGP